MQDDTARKPEMKLAVPEMLKVLLVDDWEAVTKNSQVRGLFCCFCASFLIVGCDCLRLGVTVLAVSTRPYVPITPTTPPPAREAPALADGRRAP